MKRPIDRVNWLTLLRISSKPPRHAVPPENAGWYSVGVPVGIMSCPVAQPQPKEAARNENKKLIQWWKVHTPVSYWNAHIQLRWSALWGLHGYPIMNSQEVTRAIIASWNMLSITNHCRLNNAISFQVYPSLTTVKDLSELKNHLQTKICTFDNLNIII